MFNPDGLRYRPSQKSENMTLTHFFKGNETHRNEYIVLWQNGEFYEAYGKDAERLAYCTGVTLTRPKDGSRARAGFPWRQLMTGGNGYGRYLSKMLHSFLWCWLMTPE